MAPLGTDDEAGGTSPTPERVQLARAHELNRSAPPAPGPEGPSAEGAGAGGSGAKFAVIGLLVVALAAAIAVILLAG
jgi:hypothetical protein